MSNRKKEENAVIDFFRDFTAPIRNTFKKEVNIESLKDLGIFVIGASVLTEQDKLDKSAYFVCKASYTVDKIDCDVFVLLEKELVATLADLLMAGDGTNAFTGSLDELEINSSMKVVTNCFKNIKTTFADLHKKELQEKLPISELKANSKEYEQYLTDKGPSYVIVYSLKLTKDKTYKIPVIAGEECLKKILASLGLLKIEKALDANILKNMDMITDLKIGLTVELGRTQIPLKMAMALDINSLVELDAHENDDVKIFANGNEVALGQIVAVEDNFGIKITKILSKSLDFAPEKKGDAL